MGPQVATFRPQWPKTMVVEGGFFSTLKNPWVWAILAESWPIWGTKSGFCPVFYRVFATFENPEKVVDAKFAEHLVKYRVKLTFGAPNWPCVGQNGQNGQNTQWPKHPGFLRVFFEPQKTLVFGHFGRAMADLGPTKLGFALYFTGFLRRSRNPCK